MAFKIIVCAVLAYFLGTVQTAIILSNAIPSRISAISVPATPAPPIWCDPLAGAWDRSLFSAIWRRALFQP
jgi:hypothetical protein